MLLIDGGTPGRLAGYVYYECRFQRGRKAEISLGKAKSSG